MQVEKNQLLMHFDERQHQLIMIDRFIYQSDCLQPHPFG